MKLLDNYLLKNYVMSKKLTTEEFIAKAKEIHGEKYDYSKVTYTNSHTKVIITCLIHGDFEQSPVKHVNNSQGCSKCSKKHNYTTEEFIIKANLIHNNKYLYESTLYKNNRSLVLITCLEHGIFKQRPNEHLMGKGCAKCGISRSNTSEFIEKSVCIHKERYLYDKVSYVNNYTKVIITCPQHGDFEQKPASHTQGHGCPSCANHGFDPNRPGILYYLKITTDADQILYKIGITNNSVNERFSLKELSKIEIVKQILYEVGQDAYDFEQKLLKMYKQYQYTGPKILECGNTELFTENILSQFS